MIKVSKNKEKFLVSIILNIALFIVGLIFILVPTYYGVDKMGIIDVNNLFLIAMLVISILKLGEYFVNRDNPNKEAILVAIISCISGILNNILSSKIDASYSLSISVLTFVFLLSAVKIFTIDYYHDRKNIYHYIEFANLAVLLLVGTLLSFSMFSDSILQTVELGFFIVLYSIIEGFNATFRGILSSKSALKRLKVM